VIKKLLATTLLLLAACDPVPQTTTVSKSQDYTMPLSYTVDVKVLDPVTLTAMCRLESEIGCQIWDTPDRASIYVSSEYEFRNHAMEHEFQHLVYGPAHH